MSSAVALRRGERGWPERLDHLQEPPDLLWVLGRLPRPEVPCVAVVGARRATAGGVLTARELGRDLGEAGVATVSGMARGIDAAAHLGAIDAGAPTVAVLGCGIDLCYPAEHAGLRARIVGCGAVISEDGGDAAPLPWRFPRRNRLIAALVEAVVVVEATERSGALSTARWAADLGREVLAVPGSIRSPSSAGTNLLIRDGVRPYLGLADLFEAAPHLRRASGNVGGRGGVARSRADTVTPQADGDCGEGGDLQHRVLDALGGDPVHPEELAQHLGVGAADLAVTLTTLRLRGAVADVCGGRLVRTV